MELQQLRYVAAIAETGSFSRAAEHCHVAQPSLSQQVARLEDDLGARLFDRLGRRVRLTEAGRAFLPRARAILAEVEAARAEVDTQRTGLQGSVTVGVIPTVAPYLMPSLVASFAQQYPQARLRVTEATTPVLAESLRNLGLDLAVLALPLRYKEFACVPLRTEPLLAVLPHTHPLARAESVSLRELRGENFVMLRDGHCFRGLSLALCSRARLRPRIVFESDQFRSLLGMVAAGVGVTLLPRMAVDRTPGCCYVPLRDARATRTLVAAVVRGRSLTPIQQALLAQLRTVKPNLGSRTPAA